MPRRVLVSTLLFAGMLPLTGAAVAAPSPSPSVATTASAPSPTVSSISPPSGTFGSTGPMTVNGTNFASPMRAIFIKKTGGNFTSATVVSVAGASQLTLTIPSSLPKGSYWVIVGRKADNRNSNASVTYTVT